MQKELFRLSLYSVALLIFVMLFTMLSYGHKWSFAENIHSSFGITLYLFMFQNLIISLVPAIFAIGYTFVVFPLFKNHPRQLSIMVINAIILILLSLTIGLVIFHHTSWLHGFSFTVLTKFTKTITIIGLLSIILSFTFGLIKKK